MIMNQIKSLVFRIVPEKLDRKAIIVIFGDSITFVSSFVGLMILSRLFTVEEMGTYKQVMYVVLMFVSVIDMSLGASIYRFWNFYQVEERKQLLDLIFYLSLLLSIIASILIAALSGPISVFYKNPLLRNALLITSVFPISFIPFSLIRPFLICIGDVVKGTMLEVVTSILLMISLIVPSLLGMNLQNILAIWILVSLIKTIMAVILIRPSLLSLKKYFTGKIFKDVSSYSGILHLSRFPGIFLNYFDKVITSTFLSLREFAVYSIGAREIPFINTIGYSISNVTIPELVKDFQAGNIDTACDRWKSIIKKTSILTYPLITFCVWYASPLTTIIFSSLYEESGDIFRIFCLISYFRVVEYASIAKSMGKTQLIIQSSLLSALTMLLISFPLIYFFKGIGISIALLISSTSSIIYLLSKYRCLLKKSLSSFYPWKELLILITISIVSIFLVDKFMGGFSFFRAREMHQIIYLLEILIVYLALFYYSYFAVFRKYLSKNEEVS